MIDAVYSTRVWRYLLILGGILSLGLGTIGILLPGLPTTPFVLLAAGLFVRSSDTLYRRLMASRLYGRYLQRYMEKRGMSRRMKLYALVSMWLMISLSIYLIQSRTGDIIVALAGICGTVATLFLVRTVE